MRRCSTTGSPRWGSTCKDVRFPTWGAALSCILQFDYPREGFVNDALMLAMGAPWLNTKLVVAVSHDTDIDDAREVYHAIATRCDPARDVIMVPNTRGSPLRPVGAAARRPPSVADRRQDGHRRHRASAPRPRRLRARLAEELGQGEARGLSLTNGGEPSWTPSPRPSRKSCSKAEPFIPYMTEEKFDARLKPVVEPYKKRMGFLPNALKLYAYRPEIAETLWKLNSNVMRDPSSTLDQLLKRKLAAVACSINGCAYCTAHSCAMLKKPAERQATKAGASASRSCRTSSPATWSRRDEFERVCFDYVRAASEDPTSVPGRDPAAAEAAPYAAADHRARLRRRVLEVLQYRARQPAYSGRVAAPGRYRICRSLGIPAIGRRAANASRARRRGPRAAAGYALPLTVSREALIESGSDERFRALVIDLLTIATRMEVVREHHGRRMGISGPQYSVLIAVAHLQGAHGASVGAVAQALHVSSAFVASETGKLARRGLVFKRVNPRDRRGVLLSLAPAGRLAIDRAGGEIRAINDLFFGALDRKSFDALCSRGRAALVTGSRKALHYLSAVEDDTHGRSRRTG